MKKGRIEILRWLLTALLFLMLPSAILAQENTSDKEELQQEVQEEKKERKKRDKKEVVPIVDFTQGFTVKGGEKIMPKVRTPETDSLEAAQLTILIDSLVTAREAIQADDSLALASMSHRIDSLAAHRKTLIPELETPADSLLSAADSLLADSLPKPRYNWLFRDSLSLATTTLLSVAIPGFAQVYEEDYWKVPLQYAMVGLPLWGGIHQNKIYQGHKAEFDKLVASGASQAERSPVQAKMLEHKGYRTMFFGAALTSYMGFLVDGVINHPSSGSDIQKATTLSMVFPGAGQIYNGSYWKVPIVIVGAASMAYVIDWNQRGYDRFKLAYDLATDGDDSTVSEFPHTSEESLRSIRNSYRRNRDLAIIGAVAVYLVQVADAHIDAHMQAYDISDKLSMEVEPQIIPTMSPSGYTHNYGFNLTMHF